MNNFSDEQVARQVQGGDIEAFGSLIERFEAKMSRYSKRFLIGYEDSQDLVQNVFLKAYQHINSFNSSLSFNSWIYRIAHNEFINFIKKKGKEPMPFFDGDSIFPHPISREDPHKDLMIMQDSRQLEENLHKLQPKYREVLVLYFFEEMSYEEISDILKVPVSTVGVRLSRAKAELSKLYKL